MKLALLGNSNVGKSTIFNALTGAKQKTVNAPGTTISLEEGVWAGNELLDLPGLISFAHISPDEEVSANAVMKSGSPHRPDAIIFVASALHMSRGLYLLAQAKASKIPIIFVVTMIDLALKHGVKIDASKLKEVTGVHAVILADSREKNSFEEELKNAVEEVKETKKGKNKDNEKSSKNEKTKSVEIEDVHFWAKENSETHFEWVLKAEKELGFRKMNKETIADKVDKILLNKFFGGIFFLAMMFILFQITTTLANPVIDFFDITVRQILSDFVSFATQFLPDFVQSFIQNVIVEGILTVLTFLPPMFFIFIALAFLEESGYLARAAFVNDRYMRLLGLDGRAILPLILGYGCNLPAISAVRVLPDDRSRKMTMYLIPFTLCSARLAVFVVLAHAFFPNNTGLVIFALYLISIALVLFVGIVMNLFKKVKNQRLPFIISLPPYQAPKMSSMLKSCGIKLLLFVKTCGVIVMIVIAVLWGLQNVAVDGEETAYDAVTQTVSPVFSPLGFDDPHFASAIITGFLAKEVVVGSMAASYNVDDPDDESEETSNALSSKLHETMTKTSKGHFNLAAFSFLLFVLAYVPCLATITGLKKEGGGKLALRSVLLSLCIAYFLAFVVFQGGVLLSSILGI